MISNTFTSNLSFFTSIFSLFTNIFSHDLLCRSSCMISSFLLFILVSTIDMLFLALYISIQIILPFFKKLASTVDTFKEIYQYSIIFQQSIFIIIIFSFFSVIFFGVFTVFLIDLSFIKLILAQLIFIFMLLVVFTLSFFIFFFALFSAMT